MLGALREHISVVGQVYADLIRGRLVIPEGLLRKTGLMLGFAFVALLALQFQPYRLYFNMTPSEPLGFYWVKFAKPGAIYDRNQLVQMSYECPQRDEKGCVLNNVAPYRDGFPILKRIRGVPGDQILTVTTPEGLQHQIVTPKGLEYFSGEILKVSPSGRPVLYHPSFTPGSQIEAGEYYLGSTLVKQSFDSRYYGLVPASRMVGTATPFITW